LSFLLWNFRFAGAILVVLGLAHAYFPRRFDWPQHCEGLPLLTRQLFFVHNAFIGFAVFLQGVLCLVLAEDLVRPSRLAGAVLAGLAAFWGARLWTQLFVYKAEHWRGKRFETAVHVAFICLWVYFAASFGYGAWQQFFS